MQLVFLTDHYHFLCSLPLSETMGKRLPTILGKAIDDTIKTLNEQHDEEKVIDLTKCIARMQELMRDLSKNRNLRPIIDDGEGDIPLWNKEIAKFFRGKNFMNSPWLFVSMVSAMIQGRLIFLWPYSIRLSLLSISPCLSNKHTLSLSYRPKPTSTVVYTNASQSLNTGRTTTSSSDKSATLSQDLQLQSLNYPPDLLNLSTTKIKLLKKRSWKLENWPLESWLKFACGEMQPIWVFWSTWLKKTSRNYNLPVVNI